jgi:hypothetical protein
MPQAPGLVPGTFTDLDLTAFPAGILPFASWGSSMSTCNLSRRCKPDVTFRRPLRRP